MKKQMLNPEALRVDSFETGVAAGGAKALYTVGSEPTCYTCGISPVVAETPGPTTVHCCV